MRSSHVQPVDEVHQAAVSVVEQQILIKTSTRDDHFGHETATVWAKYICVTPRSTKAQLRALYGPRTVGGAMVVQWAWPEMA